MFRTPCEVQEQSKQKECQDITCNTYIQLKQENWEKRTHHYQCERYFIKQFGIRRLLLFLFQNIANALLLIASDSFANLSRQHSSLWFKKVIRILQEVFGFCLDCLDLLGHQVLDPIHVEVAVFVHW